MKRLFVFTVLLVALLVLGAQPVLADRSYHTHRLPLALTEEGANAGHTLRNGWVVNIHPNGPVMGAIEEYHLSGAMPDTDYEIFWRVLDSPWGPLGDLSTGVVLQTNKHGKAQSQLQISREWQEAQGLTNMDLTVAWVLKSGGLDVYVTAAHDVHID